ncbi:hypothetical protein E6C60_0123 [Paenibacillus algicola]|uniref:Uncharacterized protein n=1 Tax=Paenibacillus algicola TaxID=2565926 RepID=A0A4P8XHF0_9BACL|nr:hypothetical protein E6C60_0123 [Paenibacillus algicola]
MVKEVISRRNDEMRNRSARFIRKAGTVYFYVLLMMNL